MRKLWLKLVVPSVALCCLTPGAKAWDKGIYLTQYTLEKPDKLDYLIREAKATGINTFVIDHEYYSSHYAPAIAKVKAAGLKMLHVLSYFLMVAMMNKFIQKRIGKKN